ncbi:AfsR/SARP family transcriptional regulator [Gordonibacter sp.]|uniref:AfsR/SARP family transcriptional regulator n=1 Tax=Gordonibacter sp. TaxID=1968902 RepID=UPI002FCAC614
MTSYLAKSACNGHRPSHLASRRHYPRPDLIARLLRERHVARFLVAPVGFGKSGLAMEYAEVVFSFDQVFWIDGRSPCFLRDLDRGIIASELSALESRPFLAVFDDVPPLDAVRADSFSAAFDSLLARDCEVLVCCAPSCDAFAASQHDRLKLSAPDLLLTDTEIDAVQLLGDGASTAAETVPASGRVPGLRWGGFDGEAVFLAGALREELPADVLLAIATMLVLGTGSLSDAAAFGPFDDDLAAMLAANYPYLGIDRRCERFGAPSFSEEAIAAAVGKKLDVLAKRSLFGRRDALVGRWADALVSRSECRRACGLVKTLCSRTERAVWLSSRSLSLLRQACILPGHELHASLGAAASTARLETGEMMRLIALGDEAGALGRARQMAFDLAESDEVRALSLLVLVRRGGGSVRTRACKELARLAQGGAAAGGVRGPRGSFASHEAFWRPLVLLQLSMLQDPLWIARGVEADFRARGASEDALCLMASWVLKEVAEGRAFEGAGDSPANREAVCRIERFVTERLARGGDAYDLFAASAGLALEQARERGTLVLRRPLGAAEVLALHHLEMEVFTQRRAFDRAVREREERRAERAATLPDSYLDGRYLPKRTQAAGIVPPLTVNLFGGLDVRIGGEVVDVTRFRRQKAKTLLALLVLNRGREFPRDQLVRVLWPDSEMDTARKNFYSVWSLLRRTLAGPSGVCPYLLRHQNGCRIDERLLSTDVARFDAVCRMLLFGQPGSDGWAQLYAEIDDAFADDLMPSERGCDLIIQARNDCRMQLVDALVAAANRLVATDGVQEGLWFARAALRRDRTREDAYVALMRAQIAAGQRTAALETYFSCRRVLTSELGIDPSLGIMALYRSIIETEEPMD